MTTEWGCDTCGPANQSYNGTTLADYVRNNYFVPDSLAFWARYVAPVGSSGCQSLDVDPYDECVALKNAGFNWIQPVTTPGDYSSTGNSTNDYNRGYSDGQAACATIINAINNSSGRLAMPGGGVLYLYLDVEANTSLSSDYWNGWATAIYYYQYNGGTPFFECCYCNPSDGLNTCSVLSSATGAAVCYGIWSSEPEPLCSGCYSPGPSWAPNQCANLTTFAWQYGEQDPCINYGQPGACFSNFPPVDLDQTNPTAGSSWQGGPNDVVNNMLYLN